MTIESLNQPIENVSTQKELKENSHTGPAMDAEILENIHKIINWEVENGNLKKNEASDLIDRMEAVSTIDQAKSNILTIYESQISNNEKVNEFKKMTRDFNKTIENLPAKDLKDMLRKHNDKHPKDKINLSGNKAELLNKVKKISKYQQTLKSFY